MEPLNLNAGSIKCFMKSNFFFICLFLFIDSASSYSKYCPEKKLASDSITDFYSSVKKFKKGNLCHCEKSDVLIPFTFFNYKPINKKLKTDSCINGVFSNPDCKCSEIRQPDHNHGEPVINPWNREPIEFENVVGKEIWFKGGEYPNDTYFYRGMYIETNFTVYQRWYRSTITDSGLLPRWIKLIPVRAEFCPYSPYDRSFCLDLPEKSYQFEVFMFPW